MEKDGLNMAEPYIWGNLARANNDPTLIDEAIEQAVTTHNNDPDAHLGDDQALQSHRAAEIIDHRAESVVNDKIRVGARTFVAIVGSEPGDDYDNLEDAVDYAWSQGGGSIKVRKGTYTPTRDLKVRYGVDIYGEGPQETIIDMDEHGLKNLNFSQEYTLTVDPLPTLQLHAGEDWAEVMNNDVVDPDWLIDMEYRGVPTLMGEEGFFGNGPYFGTVALADQAETDDLLFDVEVHPTLSCVGNTATVYINGWQLCTGFEQFVGLELVTDSGSYGEVKAYLGDGEFELYETVATSRWRETGVHARGDVGRMSILQGVTIEARNTSELLRVNSEFGRVFIRDCTLNIGYGLFPYPQYYSTLVGGGCTIENSVIRCMQGTTYLWTSGCVMRNCKITAPSSNAIAQLGGIGAMFENCLFGNALNQSISSIQHYTNFNNCSFNNSLRGTITAGGTSSGTIPNPHVYFSNCEVHIVGSSGLLLYGYGVIVVGCFFYGGGATIGLHTNSRYSTFSCNVVKNAIAATPTNCVAVGNIQMA